MYPRDPINGWVEYRRLVLSELDRLSDGFDTLNRRITTLNIEVTKLKMKSQLWGGLSGLLAALATLLVKMVVMGGK